MADPYMKDTTHRSNRSTRAAWSAGTARADFPLIPSRLDRNRPALRCEIVNDERRMSMPPCAGLTFYGKTIEFVRGVR